MAGKYINKEQNNIKERILYCSMDFTHELLTNNDLYSALSNGIAMLGNATQVDRVYYWENHYDEESKRWLTSQKVEWCLDDVDSQIDNLQLQNVPLEGSIDFLGTLAAEKTFSSHIKDMYNGKNSTKQTLEDQGILSILAIPVFVNHEFRGFMGFDSCKVEKEWSQVEISLLNSFALLYAKALERDLLEKNIVQVKENFSNFFNMIEDLLLVLDFDGKIIYVNNNVLQRANYSREELIGKSFLMLHPKDQAQEIQKNFQDIINKKAQSFNVPALTKDGHTFPVETINTEGLWDGKKVIFCVVKDVSELSISEEKFSATFNNSGVSMFISRFENGDFLDVNDTFLDLIGYRKDEIIGKNIGDLQMIKGQNNRNFITDGIERDGKISDFEVEIIGKDGAIRTGLVNVVPLKINQEKCLLSSIIDISDRVAYEAKLLELYNRDSLTGVYTRHYVYEKAEEIIQEYKKNDKIFSVAIIDIDYFKNVNDQYGHQIGDYVLIEFAKIIADSLRLHDILGRYGGEEFILLLNHSDRHSSNIVLKRILTIFRKTPLLFADNQIGLTFSAGISSADELEKDLLSIDRLVEIADQRMYHAKESGRNRIIYKTHRP